MLPDNMTSKLPVLASLLPLFLLSSCVVNVGESGPAHTLPVNVDLGNAEMARVEIHMKIGELKVSGGGTHLVEGSLSYAGSAKPDVRTDSIGFRNTVILDQRDAGQTSGSHGKNYQWDLRLNNDVPLDFQADFGVGEGRLDLGSLNLRNVDLHMGVGEIRLDLRGNPKRDYEVNIRGGVGQATIYLPNSVGVIAKAHGGIGGIKARGLDNRDGDYVNAAYGHAPVTIRLDVSGGIGEIDLISE